jgi:hypothetical protein
MVCKEVLLTCRYWCFFFIVYIQDAIWLDAKNDVSFTSYASVDNACSTYGIYGMEELSDDFVGSNTSDEEEGK